MSIPALYSSVAILKLAEFNYTGPIGLITRVMLEKKYALPLRVIYSLSDPYLCLNNDHK